MSLQEFFSKAGAFVTKNVYSTGDSPQRTWIVETLYENGYSRYNGAQWQFVIS